MKESTKKGSRITSTPKTLNYVNFWETASEDISSVSTRLYHFSDVRENKIYVKLEVEDVNSNTIRRVKCGSFITQRTLNKLNKKHNIQDYKLEVESFLRPDEIQKLLGNEKYSKLMKDVHWYARNSMIKCLSKQSNSELANFIKDKVNNEFCIENGGVIFTIKEAKETGLTSTLEKIGNDYNAGLNSNNKLDVMKFIFVILNLIANLHTSSKSIYGHSRSNKASSLLGKFSDDMLYRYARILLTGWDSIEQWFYKLNSDLLQLKFQDSPLPNRIIYPIDGTKVGIKKITNADTLVQLTYSSSQGYIHAANVQRIICAETGAIVTERVFEGKKMDYDLLESLIPHLKNLFGEDISQALFVTDRGYSIKPLWVAMCLAGINWLSAQRSNIKEILDVEPIVAKTIAMIVTKCYELSSDPMKLFTNAKELKSIMNSIPDLPITHDQIIHDPKTGTVIYTYDIEVQWNRSTKLLDPNNLPENINEPVNLKLRVAVVIKEKLFADKLKELPKYYREAWKFVRKQNSKAGRKENRKNKKGKTPKCVSQETAMKVAEHPTYEVYRPTIEELVRWCLYYLMTNDLTLNGKDMVWGYDQRHPIERSFNVTKNLFREEGVNTAKDDGVKVATLLPAIAYNLSLPMLHKLNKQLVEQSKITKKPKKITLEELKDSLNEVLYAKQKDGLYFVKFPNKLLQEYYYQGLGLDPDMFPEFTEYELLNPDKINDPRELIEKLDSCLKSLPTLPHKD